jgi:hypothetical protein
MGEFKGQRQGHYTGECSEILPNIILGKRRTSTSAVTVDWKEAGNSEIVYYPSASACSKCCTNSSAYRSGASGGTFDVQRGGQKSENLSRQACKRTQNQTKKETDRHLLDLFQDAWLSNMYEQSARDKHLKRRCKNEYRSLETQRNPDSDEGLTCS